jgi:hypothetical protein
MTLSKAMQFEDIPLKKVSKTALKNEVKKERENNINMMSTTQIMWHLVGKHKYGLVLTYAIISTTLFFFHTLIFGLLKSL